MAYLQGRSRRSTQLGGDLMMLVHGLTFERRDGQSLLVFSGPTYALDPSAVGEAITGAEMGEDSWTIPENGRLYKVVTWAEADHIGELTREEAKALPQELAWHPGTSSAIDGSMPLWTRLRPRTRSGASFHTTGGDALPACRPGARQAACGGTVHAGAGGVAGAKKACGVPLGQFEPRQLENRPQVQSPVQRPSSARSQEPPGAVVRR